MSKLNKSTHRDAVRKVLRYFTHFSYPPSFEEIYTFLPIEITKRELKNVLNDMVQQKKLITHNLQQTTLYALPPHRTFFNKRTRRASVSRRKIKKIGRLIKIISWFQQIRLVGLSGSIALLHATKSDDIDLFVITSPKRLWTGRFVCLVAAQLLGLRRRRGEAKAKNKVCLNLLFDASDLAIPKHKRNLYVAHEVLQMRPLTIRGRAYNNKLKVTLRDAQGDAEQSRSIKSQKSKVEKGTDIYSRFLRANKWVYDFFPNAQPKLKWEVGSEKKEEGVRSGRSFLNILELILKKLQLYFINKHQTTEIITNTQLWFFPDDFEKVLRRKNLV